MFVDVLHHASEIDGPGAESRKADRSRARSSGITRLLSEAARVSRRYVLIKDHVSESALDFKTLQFMDWVGNRPHGVVLPYHYQSRQQWEQYFAQTRLVRRFWGERKSCRTRSHSAATTRRKLAACSPTGKTNQIVESHPPWVNVRTQPRVRAQPVCVAQVVATPRAITFPRTKTRDLRLWPFPGLDSSHCSNQLRAPTQNQNPQVARCSVCGPEKPLAPSRRPELHKRRPLNFPPPTRRLGRESAREPTLTAHRCPRTPVPG